MARLPDGYEITRADVEEIPALIAVNQAADTLFEGTGLVDGAAACENVPSEVFEAAIAARHVLVMRETQGAAPVGFALTSERGGTLYLDQVSVRPDHGRKGLGRALVRRVIADARRRGLAHVTLSTFRDLPWNGPFYRSLGFREIRREKMADWMCELETAQAETLDVAQRCFMQKRARLMPGRTG